jgi:hypothetical protein
MTARTSLTIPCLPCASLDESLAFWRALRFEVPLVQRAPNPYAVIEYEGDFQIHLFGLAVRPEDNFSTCLVVVPEIEGLHARFSEGMRALLGRAPGRGFPRISRLRPGQTRFTLTDVAGNSIIFVRRDSDDDEVAEAYKQPDLPPLQKALHLATRLREFKNDDRAAAKVLDTAVRKHALDFGRVLLARLELAHALEEGDVVEGVTARLGELTLGDEDAATFDRERAALAQLLATRASDGG